MTLACSALVLLLPLLVVACLAICIESRGDVYVGEVTWSGGAKDGVVPADCHSLQKFVRA